MDGVQGRVTRFRAPGGAPDSGSSDEPDEPGYRDRPMPVAVAILWKPVSAAGQGLPTIPIFIMQRALAAVHDHRAATSETCFGFLTGDLFRPETGAPYVVVESTIRLPGESGNDAKSALVQGWVVAQDVLRKTGDQLVGWYRTGDAPEPGLSGAEVEAHAALFLQPWQIVVTVGSGPAPVGGVFRPSAGNGSGLERLPFYEVLDHAAVPPDGTKHTSLHWTNYRSEEPTLLPAGPVPAVAAPVAAPPVPAPPAARPSRPAPMASASRLPPLVFLPDQVGAGRVPKPTAGAVLRRLSERPLVRVATYAAVGLAVIVGSVRLFRASPAAQEPPPGTPAVAAPPLQRLDRAADTLALALAAFDLRARLFASRQMRCPELARGLVLVEERWTSYNAVRKDSGVALDSARTARDRALYADADAVERRFESSLCPRP